MIYLAGNTKLRDREEFVMGFVSSVSLGRLVSYFYDGEQVEWLWDLYRQLYGRDGMLDLFLDSGAFSAKTQGVKIDIQKYITFIRQREDLLTVYANLDVIHDAEASYRNLRIMERAGLNPLPVWHLGEPLSYLKRYVSEYEYIALGGMVTQVVGVPIAKYLDQVFQEIICDSSGFPRVKVHGFGLTSVPLMWRYPWYSVDSTSWVQSSRNGMILVPPPGLGGVRDYRKPPISLVVSNRKVPQVQDVWVLSNLSGQSLSYVMDYLEEKGFVVGRSEFHWEDPGVYELKEGESWVGKKRVDGLRKVETIVEPGLSNMYQYRDRANIQYFLDLEAQFPPWPRKLEIKVRRRGLL